MKITKKRLESIILEEHMLLVERPAAKEGQVVGYPGDDDWDYKMVDGVWYAKKKTWRKTWVNISSGKNASSGAVENLNRTYPELSTSGPTKKPKAKKALKDPPTFGGWDDDDDEEIDDPHDDTDPSTFEIADPSFASNIVDRKTGNHFRGWVRDNKNRYEIKTALYGESDKTLGRDGPHNNDHVKKAWRAFGIEYLESEKEFDSDEYISTAGTGEIKYAKGIPASAKILTGMADLDSAGPDGVGHRVMRCSKSGCAAYVSERVGWGQGNAWHAHTISNPTLRSVFNGEHPRVHQALADMFADMNTKAKTGTPKDKNTQLKSFLQVLAQNKKRSMPKLGDVVGLLYAPSSWFTRAFFEGATGYSKMGHGVDQSGADGPFFRTKDGYKAWTPDMLGKDIEFVPGNTLKRGKGFGMNTHLGIVGALTPDGVPIVFHNIGGASASGGGQVFALPINKMSSDTIDILWSKTPTKRVTESKKKNILA